MVFFVKYQSNIPERNKFGGCLYGYEHNGR